MFKINTDLSIEITRGDAVELIVTAQESGKNYVFKTGEIVRFKVFEKKGCDCVVLQKDFGVESDTEEVTIVLEEADTKIGELIHKPKDYWYEVELNPDTFPNTIIGYDAAGAKVFKLYPEGRDLGTDPIMPEDIPFVDKELDMTSHNPVENQAIAKKFAEVDESVGKNATAIRNHANNKENPHSVTVAQIGAVPTSRTVNGKSLTGNIALSASDVGARPNTWMPTAEQVGARPSTWTPTAEQVGAAPTGYGYGGYAISLNDVASEAELDTALATIYDNMAARETKLVTYIGYPTSGWRWFGIISKSSANNGSFVAHSAVYGGCKVIKTKNGGTWQPIEWENPPMLPGIPYRTIERFNNKPVYKKLVVYTNADAISSGTNLPIPHGITNLSGLISVNASTDYYLLPYVSASTSSAVSGWNSTNITMNWNSSWGAGRTWYFELRYTINA